MDLGGQLEIPVEDKQARVDADGCTYPLSAGSVCQYMYRVVRYFYEEIYKNKWQFGWYRRSGCPCPNGSSEASVGTGAFFFHRKLHSYERKTLRRNPAIPAYKNLRRNVNVKTRL